MMRLALLPVFLLSLIVPGAIRAQGVKDDKIKPAVGQEGGKITNAAFDPSKGKLKHGQMITVNSGKGDYEAIVVRYDPKNLDLVFVRAEPGTLPKSVKISEVKSLALKEGKNGRPAAPVMEPEIQGIEFINGTRRTMSYSAPTLSPGELSLLREIQDAHNSLAELESKADRENQLVQTSVLIQNEQLRTLQLLNRQQEMENNFLQEQAARAYWGWGTGAWGWSGYDINGWVGSPGLPIGQMYGAQRMNYPIAPIHTPNLAVLTVTPEALAKSRQNVVVLQDRGIYEQNRLVAVVVAP